MSNSKVSSPSTTVDRDEWFAVDPIGIADHFDVQYIVRELLANSLDEEGVSHITVTVKESSTEEFPDQWEITVEDNAPKGFSDLKHAYTLFGRTPKVEDPEVRGRFNHGCKGALSHCNRATIITTKGQVDWYPNGKRGVDEETTTEVGTVVTMYVNLDEETRRFYDTFMENVIVPEGVTVVYNGEELPQREPQGTISEVLPTWKLKEDGGTQHISRRRTDIEVFDTKGDSYICELGIPVEVIPHKFTINVKQKIPLDMKRDTVKKSYLDNVYGAVANINVVTDSLTVEDLAEDWGTSTIKSDRTSPKVKRKLVEKKMGSKKLAVYDPFNSRANDMARDKGYTLIKPKDLPSGVSKEMREDSENMSNLPSLSSTSKIFKTKIIKANTIPRSEWTEDMEWLAKITTKFAKFADIGAVRVKFLDNPEANDLAGDYGRFTVRYNLGSLGRSWLKRKGVRHFFSMIVHELAHEYSPAGDTSHVNPQYRRGLEELSGYVAEFIYKYPEDIDNRPE